MAIDLNDPETWDDMNAVAEAALRAANGEEPEVAETDAAQTAAAMPAQATRADAEQDADLVTERGSVIPAKALSEARAERAAALEELAAARAELEALRGAQPAATGAAPAAVDPDWANERAALEEELARAREDGDEQIERLVSAQIRMGDRLAAEAAHRQAQVQAAQMDDAAARDAAWAQAETLQAWAADTAHPGLHQTAVRMHEALIADPSSAYARMSWAERFQALPGLVQEHLGLPVTAPTAGRAEAPRARAGNGQFAKAAPAVPTSMSQIPGGAARDVAARGVEDLNGLSTGEQQAALVGVLEKGGLPALMKFLNDVPFGGLNVPGARQ